MKVHTLVSSVTVLLKLTTTFSAIPIWSKHQVEEDPLVEWHNSVAGMGTPKNVPKRTVLLFSAKHMSSNTSKVFFRVRSCLRKCCLKIQTSLKNT